MAVRVRAEVGKHPVLDAFVNKYNLDRERAHDVMTDSVLEAMDLLGHAYVGKMTRTVTRMAELREAIHFVYERVLTGDAAHADVMSLRHNFDELHKATSELADPKAWAEREGAAVEPLPVARTAERAAPGAELRPVAAPGTEVGAGSGQARAEAGQAAPATRRRREVEYPGKRSGLADKPTRAPRNGEPMYGGGNWEVKTHPSEAITWEIGPDGPYWKKPELKDGQVMHFPDYGYRVWKDPVDGTIVEELLVGPSVTKSRKLTRGEDVLMTAADVSELYRTGKIERAHGAGSPGLGFDAQYGVAHANQRINQWLENRGVEQWTRDLRDNAEPGVEYLWTTRTKKSGQALAEREYTISAVVDGQIYELYVFETKVPPGSPDALSVEFTLTGVSPAAEYYGAPVTVSSRAALEANGGKGPIERVAPPEVITEALGRRLREAPEVSHPAVQRTGKKLAELTDLLNERFLRHAARPEPPGTRLRPGERAADVAMIDAIDRLTTVLENVHREITTTAPELDRLARIDAAITAFRRSVGARRTDRVTAADLRALARELRALLEEGS
jgi:hypothetical protein